MAETAKEALRFAAARLTTGLLDYFGLIGLVEWAGLNKDISKITVIFGVIVINYLLGKKFVFGSKRKRKST